MNTTDTLERCENKLSYLHNKVLEYSKAKQHVKDSAANTKKAFQVHLQEIKDNFSKLLDNSYDVLSSTIDETIAKDLQNLKMLEEGLTKDIIKIEELSTKVKGNCKDLHLETVNQAITDMGKSNPEMPIVSLSFSTKINEVALATAEEKIKDLLQLNMTGAIQILECVERPGAITIRWDEQPCSDSESVATDTSTYVEYILQATSQTTENDTIFTTIYEGDDMQYTMNFAQPDKIYSFRVCQYFGSSGGSGVCGAWSVVKSGSTTLSPHVWCEGDCVTESGLQLYQLSNGERTATKIFPESSRILHSKQQSYRLGQTLTFWIEETGESSTNDGIGLTSCKQQTPDKHLTNSEYATVMTSKGAITVNGTCMVTKLPSLKKNSVVVFQATRLTKGKLRVSISVDDKEVTFDWTTPANKNDSLYFACVFEHTGWQLSVG